MKPNEQVLYAIQLAHEKDLHYGKTGIQKIMYFALTEDLRDHNYEPYYYGPFSRRVQMLLEAIISRNEAYYKDFCLINKHNIDKAEAKDDNICKRINEVINFIPDNNLKSYEFVNISKVHIITQSLDEYDIENKEPLENIRDRCRLYGWKDLLKENKRNVTRYIDLGNNLDKSLGINII